MGCVIFCFLLPCLPAYLWGGTTCLKTGGSALLSLAVFVSIVSVSSSQWADYVITVFAFLREKREKEERRRERREREASGQGEQGRGRQGQEGCQCLSPTTSPSGRTGLALLLSTAPHGMVTALPWHGISSSNCSLALLARTPLQLCTPSPAAILCLCMPQAPLPTFLPPSK